MEQNNNSDDEEKILYGGFHSDQLAIDYGILDVDSVISHESSTEGANYVEESSEHSNESSVPTIPAYDLNLILWGNYLAHYRDTNPKYIADLNGKKETSTELANLVKLVNFPGVAQYLQENLHFTEYNNEITSGIFIQKSVKEFKQNSGFDETNFPFCDSGGPQRGKEETFGYTYKYWTGKNDKSLKMRKFYIEQGWALLVVFNEPISPAASPSSSSEIKVDPAPANKKPRVGNNSPFKSSEPNSAVASPNNQPTSHGNNTNYSGPTNYSQQPMQRNGTAPGPQNAGTITNTNEALLSPEHLRNELTSLSQSVDDLTSRVTTLELKPTSGKVISVSAEQRQMCRLIIRVLRENGGRHKKGKPLATKVRKLVGGTLDTAVVNQLLYKVLAELGIITVSQDDTEWVLNAEKADEFDAQQ